jgi:hypothetical protein
MWNSFVWYRIGYIGGNEPWGSKKYGNLLTNIVIINYFPKKDWPWSWLVGWLVS